MEKSRKNKPLEPWQVEDAKRLKALFVERAGVSQERFAALHEMGGQAVVWQYLNGKIALNLQAAAKFARGLNCAVEEFSPRLAALLPSAGAKPEDLPPRVELIVELVKLLTPEQQGELLPALRATVDANRITQSKLQKKLKTVGNSRIEDVFGMPKKSPTKVRGS